MNKNYELLMKVISNSDDVSEYAFDGIEQEIDKFLQFLTNREKITIKSNYGLEDGIYKTAEEIGMSFEHPVTDLRVYFIKRQALAILRQLYASNNNSFIYNNDTIIANTEVLFDESYKEYEKECEESLKYRGVKALPSEQLKIYALILKKAKSIKEKELQHDNLIDKNKNRLVK